MSAVRTFYISNTISDCELLNGHERSSNGMSAVRTTLFGSMNVNNIRFLLKGVLTV